MLDRYIKIMCETTIYLKSCHMFFINRPNGFVQSKLTNAHKVLQNTNNFVFYSLIKRTAASVYPMCVKVNPTKYVNIKILLTGKFIILIKNGFNSYILKKVLCICTQILVHCY